MRLFFSLLLLGLVSCTPAPASFAGTKLDPLPAADFTLLDGPTGETVSLSGLRGDVVVLSFLYTQCPDICPLTASRMRAAQRALGSDASRVTFLAVSVDPARDTAEATRTFSRERDLVEGWRYLIGPRSSLQAVWSAYGVGVVDPATGLVQHSDAIYLIDSQGNKRVLMRSDQSPDDIVANVRALLK